VSLPSLCRKFTWEIIVVDDGSKDKTSAFANTTYATKYGADKCVLCLAGAAEWPRRSTHPVLFHMRSSRARR